MISPIPSFVFGQDMRIQNIGAVRDGVVFIGNETNGQFVPVGTGFLINVMIGENYRVIFVVTAAHVISKISGNTVYVRLNRKSGDAASVPIKEDKIIGWAENDVAIIPIALGSDVYEFRSLNIDEDQIAKAKEIFEGISYGDEVYAIGLYTSHYGLTRNIPVVRTGHVALLPGGEPVKGPGGNYVEAYLIELRTIAGLSGSPVYLNPPRVTVKDKKIQFLDGDFYLPIGVLIGYHVVESKEDQVVVPRFQAGEHDDEPEEDTDSPDQRNTGFGVVIPFERVMEMIKSFEPVFKKAVEEKKRESNFRTASASDLPATDENPTHREDFSRLLNVAARKPKQDG